MKLDGRKLGNNRTHGHARRLTGLSPTYNSWRGMVERCNNPKHICAALYLERGIKVCERWRKFDNFLSDMGERPAGTSIDRIDSNGDYELSNCRWADGSLQAKNRRKFSRKRGLRILTFNGESRSVSAWAKVLGISFPALRQRLHKGWTTERALATPVRSLTFSSSLGRSNGLTLAERKLGDRRKCCALSVSSSVPSLAQPLNI